MRSTFNPPSGAHSLTDVTFFFRTILRFTIQALVGVALTYLRPWLLELMSRLYTVIDRTIFNGSFYDDDNDDDDDDSYL